MAYRDRLAGAFRRHLGKRPGETSKRGRRQAVEVA